MVTGSPPSDDSKKGAEAKPEPKPKKKSGIGGGEIVNLLKTGSAFYAPAASFAQMVDAIFYDKKQILPCSVLLKGEYGINDLFVGVPIKLGSGGMDSVFEIKLSTAEQEALNKSAGAVKELVDLLPQVMG